MADRRRAACHLPAASQRAVPDREAEWSAESDSESGSLLERPMAEARARAKQQRRLQRCRLQQRRRRQCRLQAMILRQQLEAAVRTRGTELAARQGTELAARLSDSARLDWSP